jgi:predicted GIY-YIG superfamily endonuclease
LATGGPEPVAARREFQIKGWSRAKKIALIRGEYDRLKHLSRSHD